MGSEPNEIAYSGKKPSSKDAPFKINSRPAAPSPTQLELIRNLVYGLKKKKDASKHVASLEKFYHNSFFYPALLNYANTIAGIHCFFE